MTLIELRQRLPGWTCKREFIGGTRRKLYTAEQSACFGTVTISSEDPEKVVRASMAMELALISGAEIVADFEKTE